MARSLLATDYTTERAVSNISCALALRCLRYFWIRVFSNNTDKAWFKM